MLFFTTLNQQQSAARKEPEPQKRWGQAAVTAANKLYIIGGYEGTHFY